MKIAVLGSSGFVGKVLLKKLIDAKHELRVLVRNPEKLGELANRVEIVKGDYFDPESLRKSLQGTETVISAIGASANAPLEVDKYGKAIQNLVSIMNELNLKRLILIGGAATPNNGQEYFDFNRKILKVIVNLIGKHLIPIKKMECQTIMNSNLDWTIVRPPRIIPGRSGKPVCVSESRLHHLQVSVEDLTDFLIQQLDTNEWIRKTPIIS